MARLRMLLARLAALWTGRGRDCDLCEEIDAHLERLAEEHSRRGAGAGEARAAARRAFGGVTQIQDAYRDQPTGAPSWQRHRRWRE